MIKNKIVFHFTTRWEEGKWQSVMHLDTLRASARHPG